MPAKEDIPIVLINERDPFNMGFRHFVREDDSQLEGIKLKLHASGLLLEQRFYQLGQQHGIWPTYFHNGINSCQNTWYESRNSVNYYIGRNINDTLAKSWKTLSVPWKSRRTMKPYRALPVDSD